VCVCVCLSVSISSEPHVRSLTNFMCMLLWQWLAPLAGWQNSKGKGQLYGFISHWQCIVWAV